MITDSHIIDTVSAHHLFSALTDAEFQQLFSTAKTCKIEPLENVFHQGDKASRFYLVLRGHLKLYRTSPSGQEKVVEVMRKGNTFAEALMFNNKPFYPVAAQAVSESELITFDNETYLKILKSNPEAGIAIMAMSIRLHHDLYEIEMLSVENAKNRLLLFLMQNIQDKDGNEGVIELDIPKRTLASLLSIQPETFSRLLKKLAKEGLIEERRGHIRIVNIDALYAASDIPIQSVTGTSCE
ncbi:Transcriptional regulator Dnr [Moritella viscosa]|uniref:Crp/Fnr family transcriptional regulator n=1 Tax=Moritella viscosa TaxID=80854 RepID=UPI0005092042|nr:Crp/Fnr family transcriptional regulator [Moritella viscosa]CED60464.1 HTH-type transcriptional regulator, crp family [Moritella viscosa]SHO13264.1 Transcriptional regulator Dnr [Moritella viscosa]SHO23284.1 Transcriptional regulator Dnr [Moritella viscosa]